jgi:hypothetical protein
MSANYACGGRRSVVLAILSVLALGALAALPVGVTAGLIGDPTITITATDTGGTHVGTTVLTLGLSGGVYAWTKPLGSTQGEIMDAFGTVLARIKSVECEVIDDPAVKLSFVVTGGDVDAVVTFPSLTVAVPSYVNPQGSASAGITLTSNGGLAKATGQFTGVKSYRAIYNGSAGLTDWTYLVDEVQANDTTATQSERHPLTGTLMISDTVTSISSEFKFNLTAGAEAGCTSRFEVTPEPATLALLGFGAAALVARRRRG